MGIGDKNILKLSCIFDFLNKGCYGITNVMSGFGFWANECDINWRLDLSLNGFILLNLSENETYP